MLFNSLVFPVFFVLVFASYWLLPPARIRARNVLLIAASYVFYGWWDWRFLFLIIGSSAVDYVVGGRLGDTEDPARRRMLLSVSLAVNLGSLGFFKYFNFFLDSAVDLLHAVGLQAHAPTLSIILPVGISFYTFQTLSYTVDIYRRRLEPVRDPWAFFAFVSFFPQLVAGPIERASAFLPQFLSERRFDEAAARDGLRQILWGFFKKVVVADGLSPYVQRTFDGGAVDGPTAWAGTLCFALQIYGDFSGYTDIALGLARLLGFRLMRNFAYPYFSRDIGEFWRRWHISLSSWFRDYVYIPLGGGRLGRTRRIVNVLITFTVSGLWHGANWTFVTWGFLNGAYYVPQILLGTGDHDTETVAVGRALPSPREAAALLGTLVLVLAAWVFFRAASLTHAFQMLGTMVGGPWTWSSLDAFRPAAGLVAAVLLWEWPRRHDQHGLAIAHWPRPLRWLTYLGVLTALLLFGRFGSQEFIYFQF